MTDQEKQDCIESIHKAANEAPTAHDKAAPEAIYHFSRLLNALAQEADATTKLNLKIQNNLINLTRWLLALTIALLIIAGVQTVMMFQQKPTTCKNDPKADAHSEKVQTNK